MIGLTTAALFLVNEYPLELFVSQKESFNHKPKALQPCQTDCSKVSQNHLITKKGDITFKIPTEYLSNYYPEHWKPRPNLYEQRLNAKWPDMKPFSTREINFLYSEWDKVGRDKNYKNFMKDTVQIKFRNYGKTPTPLTANKLESVVIRRFGSPVDIPGIPSLQEYPENPRNNAYRTKDQFEYLADGMPAYIFCGGSPLSGSQEIKNGGCLIQMTWPNGFEVDINFGRRHLASWREVHNKSLTLLSSFIVDGELPKKTLLINKSQSAPNKTLKRDKVLRTSPLN